MLGVLDVARKAYISARGRPAQTMRGHKGQVNAVAFFKDSRRMVTGSVDSTLRIWDVRNGAFGEPFEGNHCVLSVAVSPNERRFASSGVFDDAIIIWDVESKQKVFCPLVKPLRYLVYSLCFSPNGKILASGSDDKTVVLWDAETGAVLTTLHGHRDSVFSVAFSPDGLKLASGSRDHSIRVWQTDNAELLLDINAHENHVRSVVWSPDGQQLVSASSDRTVKFWNSTNGDQIGRPCTGHTDSIHSLAISSDGSFIATASQDKTVRLWSTKTRQQIGQVLGHPTEVCCVAISSTGELLVSGGEDGNARLWFIKNILEQHNAGKKMKEDEEESRRPQHFRGSTILHDDPQLPVDDNSPGNGPSEIHKVSDSHHKHLPFDIAKKSPVHTAYIVGDLQTAEYLLNQEIDADENHNSYANRSFVRARNSDWDNALEDAKKSIATQPSLLGYISKGISLCGNHKLWDAMEAFDLASTFANRDPITIYVLLLIKAVALFNANCHDEAVRRVGDLAATYKNSDDLLCSVVNSYLRVQLAINAFEDGRYIEAADQLGKSIPNIINLLSCRTLFEPRFKIFMVLFGWDLDWLWQTVNQRLCEALFRADRVVEAVEAHQYMMNEVAKTDCQQWSTAFKNECTARCVSKGDEAFAANNHDMAIELYSAGIRLDSSCDSLFVQRSKAMFQRHLYAEALQDAKKVIELNPSSYVGYELKHATLHATQRYDEAIEAFEMMLLKLEDTTDGQICKLRQQYVSPSEAGDTIRRAAHTHLENAPLRVLNTFTGRLCNQQAQMNAFVESTEYKELLSSSIKDPHLQSHRIKEAVVKSFRWVMLSHRWESNEPLLRDIEGQSMYDLDSVGTMVKLQTFCRISRDAGYRWAWSDTCCIDQNNHVELQRSVNSMFVWYRHSALTIIYLSDVSPSAKSGALAHSVWNTRGWTVQEFLAPKVVLFYQKNWTLYLDDRSPNHKESVTIMQELEHSTGIDTQTLIAFRPGMSGAREKLQWASTRHTTLQEDVAYSLFGIFGVHLSVIYGETKQNALGRLLEAIVAQSGDITALDWVGKASEFNSCLPAEITSYKSPPCTLPSPLSEDQLQTSVSSLRDVVAVESASTLYTRLDNLSSPRFATRRLQLPCIAFFVREVRRRHGQDRETCFIYDVKADGLRDLQITTEDKLIQFSPARPTPQAFLLIRPWNRHDVGLPDFADDAKSMITWSEPMSYLDESLGGYPGEHEPVDSESHLRALRLIVRLGQPFGALLLAQQRGGEFKRIASDHNIIAQVKDTTAVHDMLDIRTLEIL
ncbi:hypothetical protein DEU56DRAFT_553851 [Suillus clintonianus]|uniref:uncharacterized protein n=1 Tax=Suillus clintonianus TaxID=1904413 RepID=UPI001B86964B|nr:uncharacterized protein DEU56DRAFT_553851 [Suillus clintonianus]KAG2151487.1 hypothetical protein DEU56DRAFT_553851 [Suillus clintonianus]